MEDAGTPEAAMASALRRLREDAGLTQAQVAEKMRDFGHNFHQSTVNKLEAGDRRLVFAEGWDLARVLDVHPSALVDTDPNSVYVIAASFSAAFKDLSQAQSDLRAQIRAVRLKMGVLEARWKRLKKFKGPTDRTGARLRAHLIAGFEPIIDELTDRAALESIEAAVGREYPIG